MSTHENNPQDTSTEKTTNKPFLNGINVTLLLVFLLALGGATLAHFEWNIKNGGVNEKSLALIGIAIFLIFASTTLNIITDAMRRYSYPHLGVGRAATIQFSLRTIGYLLILLETLSLINIPIETLLLGSAVTGIVLGVAAQQSLANFFASIILLVARPFKVGQRTFIKAGAFGEYTGIITDMGLTHTRMELDDGNTVLLPNATVLSSAAVIRLKKKPEEKKS